MLSFFVDVHCPIAAATVHCWWKLM